MKVCLIGEYSGSLDEGMRIVTYNLYQKLSKKHNVMKLDILNFSLGWFSQVKEFNPDIIHYVHGPTLNSMVISFFLARWSGAKTVISATQPKFSSFSKIFIPLFRPKIVLTQTGVSEQLFNSYHCKTRYLPNGIDLDRFRSVTLNEKMALRDKYGISTDDFVTLHIGSVRKRRNIQFFLDLQKLDGVQVLIIGSTSMPMEEELFRDLEASGCIVWRKFFQNVEEIYQLSNCYIFPSKEALSSIDIPLSVLEAMACNIGVITTCFGGLSELIEEKDGLIFLDSENNILEYLEKIKSFGLNPETRQQVLKYSWDNIIIQLEEIYDEIIQ